MQGKAWRRRPRGTARWARVLWASAAAGVVGGLASAAYLAVLELAKLLLWPERNEWLPHLGMLVGVGVVISVLLAVLGDPGGSDGLIDAVHTTGRAEKPRPLVSLVPVSLLGISAGSGIGPEPPLMRATAAIGAGAGRLSKFAADNMRVLTVTGMAAGLTVLFAAPLGAAVFALELLHRKGLEYYEAVVPACVGSMASYGVYTLVTGHGLEPVWPFPDLALRLHPTDLLLGLCAGLGGAAVAHAFAATVRGCGRAFKPLRPWLRPPVAGLLLGGVAFAFPHSLTFGEEQVAEFLRMPDLTALTLVLIAVGHMLSAAVSLAGRWQGGIIIPMFLTGYCLARAATLWTDDMGHLVLVASMMVACNVGITKTPLGSALVIAQMTGVGNLPPLLVAALVSLALTTRIAFIGGQRPRELPERAAPEEQEPPAPRLPAQEPRELGQDPPPRPAWPRAA